MQRQAVWSASNILPHYVCGELNPSKMNNKGLINPKFIKQKHVLSVLYVSNILRFFIFYCKLYADFILTFAVFDSKRQLASHDQYYFLDYPSICEQARKTFTETPTNMWH